MNGTQVSVIDFRSPYKKNRKVVYSLCGLYIWPRLQCGQTHNPPYGHPWNVKWAVTSRWETLTWALVAKLVAVPPWKSICPNAFVGEVAVCLFACHGSPSFEKLVYSASCDSLWWPQRHLMKKIQYLVFHIHLRPLHSPTETSLKNFVITVAHL